jgi:hypothetical protein
MFQLQAAQGKQGTNKPKHGSVSGERQPDALLLIREPSDEIPTCWRAMDPPLQLQVSPKKRRNGKRVGAWEFCEHFSV